MKCLRCHGMMIEERIFTREGRTAAARCLYCGDVVDIVIIINRERSARSRSAPFPKNKKRDPSPQ